MERFGSPIAAALRQRPPMPMRRVLRAYLNEAKYESLRMLRAPGLRVPVPSAPGADLPVLRCGVAGAAIAESPASRNYLFSGWSVFAVMGRPSSASAARSPSSAKRASCG